jgi:ABC-2 type transport system permease protein
VCKIILRWGESSMWNRLRILTMMQLSNKINLKFIHHRRFVAKVALSLLMIIIISILMALSLFIINGVLYIPVNVFFLIFVLMFTQVLSIISTTNGLIVDLYTSKDNQILLSFPVKNDEVFVSKLMVYYAHEFVKNLFFLFPLLIGFGYINEMPWYFYLNIIPMVIVLPLISVLVSALLSLPIMLLKHFFADRNILLLITSLIFVFLAFYYLTNVVSQIPTPIRIVPLYNRFISNISIFVQQSAKFSLIYGMIGRLLFNINTLVNYGIVLGSSLSLVILVFAISRPLYFKLTSKSLESASSRPHHLKYVPNRGIFRTFLKKEWLITRRSINELLANYSMLLLYPFLLYTLNYIYLGIPRISLGNSLVIVFDLMISLFIITSSNSASASAITLEGFEFVLLKTSPSKTHQIAWAKIMINFLFSSTMIVLSFVMFRLALKNFPGSDLWPMMILILILNSSHILWSLQIDILNPKLSEYASTGSLSNNQNISKSITIGFVLSLVFSIMFGFLSFFYYDIAWLIIIAIAIVFLAFRVVSFYYFLNAYFIDIEF